MDKFFEKISETITSKSKDIAKKAKDLVDVNTIKTSINEQKKLIHRTYTSIGEQYYKDHAKAGTTDYEVEFEIIGEANAKLKELYEELNTLKNVRVCPVCQADVEMDAVYCCKCGAKLPEVKEPGEVYDSEEVRSETDVEVESVVCEEPEEEQAEEEQAQAEEQVEEPIEETAEEEKLEEEKSE